MHLAGGGAGTDCAVGDQVGVVLREDRVEELAADGQTEARHVEEQLAADAQTRVDVVRTVEVRVVEQTLPAQRRAGLLEVHAHHDVQVIAQFVGLRGELAGVVHRGGRVVHRARATMTARRSSVPSRMSTVAARPERTVAAATSSGACSARTTDGAASGLIRTVR